jgi:hypothetical protein
MWINRNHIRFSVDFRPVIASFCCTAFERPYRQLIPWLNLMRGKRDPAHKNLRLRVPLKLFLIFTQ